MASRNLAGTRINSRQFQPSLRGEVAKPFRIRPVDGGLNTWVTSEQIKPSESPRMRDVAFHRNELRKAKGSQQIGADFADPVTWIGTWRRQDGITRTIALTNRNLYYRAASGAWTLVGPVDQLSGTLMTRWSVVVFDDTLYFVNRHTSLRSWSGNTSDAHQRVVGGYAARTMDVIANHIVLANTIDQQAVPLASVVVWSQNGSATFSGVGSGSSERFERGDHIQNVKKLGPYRGLVYKEESIIDMRATGDASQAFEFSEAAYLGLLCPYGIAEWTGGHFFIGNDEQLYVTNGSGFEPIGQPVSKEIFDLINYNSLEAVVAFFDRSSSELVLIIPTGTAPNTLASQYYAFDIFRKRWRSGVYPNVTWMTNYTAQSGLSWDEDLESWDAATDTWDDELSTQQRYTTLVATGTKRVLELTDTIQTFDGIALQFSYELPDVVGNEDGEDITLTRFKIGYIVDGEATLTIDVSTDFGQTFESSKTVRIGVDLTIGRLAYAEVGMLVTGSSIRIRVRNSVNGEKVRIVSFTLYLSTTHSALPESAG